MTDTLCNKKANLRAILFSPEHRLRTAHIALLLVGGALLFSGISSKALWFDEAYTLGSTTLGFGDMIKAIAGDVHPPLYYVLIWLWARIFGNGLTALRAFSALFAVGLGVLGFTHIRRDFGRRTGFWFSFLVFASFAVMQYALQIRMYTLAAFFVTLCAIYAWRYINDRSNMNRACFLIFSLLASYTHYFAFFAAAMINVYLLYHAVKHGTLRERKLWRADAAIQLGAYLPALVIMIWQISLGGASWIEVEYPYVIFDSLGFPFFGNCIHETVTEDKHAAMVIGLGLLALYFALASLLVKRFREKRDTVRPMLFSFELYFSVIAFGLIVSVFRPIFYVRYIMTFLSLLLLPAAYILSRLSSSIVRAGAALLLVVCLLLSVVPFVEDFYSPDDYAPRDYISAQLADGDIFAFTDCGSYALTVMFRSNTAYYFNTEDWYYSINDAFTAFGNTEILHDFSYLDGYTGRVWVINGGETYDRIMACEGSTVLADRAFDVPYQDLHYTITLIEKTSVYSGQ